GVSSSGALVSASLAARGLLPRPLPPLPSFPVSPSLFSPSWPAWVFPWASPPVFSRPWAPVSLPLLRPPSPPLSRRTREDVCEGRRLCLLGSARIVRPSRSARPSSRFGSRPTSVVPALAWAACRGQRSFSPS